MEGEIFLNKIFRNIIIKNNIFNQLRIIHNNRHQRSFTIKQLRQYKKELKDKQQVCHLRNIYLNITNEDFEIGGEKYSLTKENSIIKDLNIESLEFSNSLSQPFQLPLSDILPIHSLTELKFGENYKHSFSSINNDIDLFKNQFIQLVNLKKLVIRMDDTNQADYLYDQDFVDYTLKKFDNDERVKREYIDQLPPNLTHLTLYGDFNSCSNQLIFPNHLVKLKFGYHYFSTSNKENAIQHLLNQISNLTNLKSLSLSHPTFFLKDDIALLSLPSNLQSLSITSLEVFKTLDVLKNSNLIKLKIGDEMNYNTKTNPFRKQENRLLKIQYHPIPSTYSIYPKSLKQMIIYDIPQFQIVKPQNNYLKINLYKLFKTIVPFTVNEGYEIEENKEIKEPQQDCYKILIKGLHFYKIENSSINGNIDFIKEFINLESLSFEKNIKWNFEINDYTLPLSLKSIVFNDFFNPHELSPFYLPPSIEYLEFGIFFNCKTLVTHLGENRFPNLKVLKFDEQSIFNHEIHQFPSNSITEILFGNFYNPYSLPYNFIDCLKLKSLRIGFNFNLMLLKKYLLPRSLFDTNNDNSISLQCNIKQLLEYQFSTLRDIPITKIKFSKNFNCKLSSKSLPKTLKSIEFLDDFCLQIKSLPNSIESIIFRRSYYKDFIENSLPDSLISIYFGRTSSNYYPDFKGISILPKSFKHLITSPNNEFFINKINNLNENLSRFLFID